MDRKLKRICTIAARGGSMEVKNKNIREILNKPLLAHTIIQAKNSDLFECIAFSSDSDLILQLAEKWGANHIIKRPSELATDDASKVPVIQHCVTEVEKILNIKFDIIVDLDVTAPLRIKNDIQAAVKLFENTADASNLVTGCRARRSPYFNLVELNENGYVIRSKSLNSPVSGRQKSPPCYDMNASIYVYRRNTFFKEFENTCLIEKTIFFEMPEERSIDIDTKLDFEIVEYLMNKNSSNYTYD